jgi:hypothetical protein
MWFSYCGYMNRYGFNIVDIWMGMTFILWIYEWLWFSYRGYMNGYGFYTVDIWMCMIFILWIYEWLWFSYCEYMNGYDFHAGGIYHGIWMFYKVQLHLVPNFTMCDPLGHILLNIFCLFGRFWSSMEIYLTRLNWICDVILFSIPKFL